MVMIMMIMVVTMMMMTMFMTILATCMAAGMVRRKRWSCSRDKTSKARALHTSEATSSAV